MTSQYIWIFHVVKGYIEVNISTQSYNFLAVKNINVTCNNCFVALNVICKQQNVCWPLVNNWYAMFFIQMSVFTLITNTHTTPSNYYGDRTYMNLTHLIILIISLMFKYMECYPYIDIIPLEFDFTILRWKHYVFSAVSRHIKIYFSILHESNVYNKYGHSISKHSWICLYNVNISTLHIFYYYLICASKQWIDAMIIYTFISLKCALLFSLCFLSMQIKLNDLICHIALTYNYMFFVFPFRFTKMIMNTFL